MKISEGKIKELLSLKSDGYLYHRESRDLEFKEQFSFAGLAEYFRDFAAFANNIGGYLIFGVTNSPRKLVGLNSKSLEQFNKIDPEKISGHLLDIFSQEIVWEQFLYEDSKRKFGVFYVYESHQKPVIAKKDAGKEQEIKDGEIYFRYGGRTQKIRFAELENIIQKRIEKQNDYWKNLIMKISKIGPNNAAILDTEKGLIEKSDNQMLVIDKNLMEKIDFIKEGSFSERKGKIVLRLTGDVIPIGTNNIVKREKESLLDRYPLSAMKLAELVKKQIPKVSKNRVWQIIKGYDLKNNSDYSAYIFRNKEQEETYKETGKIPRSTPSIYNHEAVDFIVKILENELNEV